MSTNLDTTISAQYNEPVFTTDRPDIAANNPEHLLSALTRLQASGINTWRIMRDYARLATGPGKISPADFLTLRLFDEDLWGAEDKKTIVGRRCNRDICYSLNYRTDWLAVPENKVLSWSYLKTYGFPVIPMGAIYAPQLQHGAPFILRTRTMLETFLLDADTYPLFGKPVESLNSLGSIALEKPLPQTHEVQTSDGRNIAVARLALEIAEHYESGYIFQRRISPEAGIKKVCGDRLATVRFLTVRYGSEIAILGAVWKLPSGANVADNYWRAGNLLAQLHQETGAVERVTSGAGLDMQEHIEHPDTQTALLGFVHPQWGAMKALALEGARLMREVAIIGWDIACSDSGPVIVEMNENPDFFLMQFASCRGILNASLKKAIEYHARARKGHETEMKRRFANY